MIMQAMIGRVIPALVTVALTEEPKEWIITFYFRSEISDNEQQDFIEIAGDAESFLEDRPTEPVYTTSAIYRPLRSVLKFEKPPSISSWVGQDTHRLLFSVKPSLIWSE
jgi:hypothetical protein